MMPASTSRPGRSEPNGGAAARRGSAGDRGAIRAGVMPRLIRVVGAARPEETHRWQTIARARNEGFALSAAPWVMFLDDDVILDSGCVRRLADGLRTRPGFAALAADYLGESTAHGAWSRPDRHIAMGATLFRRAALSQIRFRYRAEQVRMPVLLRRPAPLGPGDRLSARGAGLAQPDRGRPREAGSWL